MSLVAESTQVLQAIAQIPIPSDEEKEVFLLLQVRSVALQM